MSVNVPPFQYPARLPPPIPPPRLVPEDSTPEIEFKTEVEKHLQSLNEEFCGKSTPDSEGSEQENPESPKSLEEPNATQPLEKESGGEIFPTGFEWSD